MHFLYAFLFGVIIAASAGCEPQLREVSGKVVDVQYLGDQHDALVQVTFDDGQVGLYRVFDTSPPEIRIGKNQRFYISQSNRVSRVEIISE